MVISDSGSQLTVASVVISEYLSQPEFSRYLSEHGIKQFEFKQYFKGNSALGSPVEICVKFVKKLVFDAIRNLGPKTP